MELSGWIFLLFSTITVTTLVSWCFYRVLTLPPHEAEEDLHAPLDIETHERE
jgi:hypothetical protein